ncbi:MAG TPA: hypothetical protein VJB57_19165 [Dehalococcoidia bacterium]|nr:hypothetical protein [Dehalococcoidia bacterium]
MDLGLVVTTVNTWKQIKLQHIALVCGLVIAASAAVAIGAWEGGSRPTAVQNRFQSGVVQPPVPAEPVLLHIYVFGSQDDADIFVSSGSSERPAILTGTIQTIVLATSEQEYTFTEAARRAMEAGALFSVVDLRNRQGSSVYVGRGPEYGAPIGPLEP